MLGVAVAFASCLCIAIVGYACSDFVARILFPKSPATCVMVIRIAVWAVPLAGVHSAIGYSLLGGGRDAAVTRSSLFAIVCSLAVGTFLMLRLGEIGACWFLVARQAIGISFTLPPFIEMVCGHEFRADASVSVAPSGVDSAGAGAASGGPVAQSDVPTASVPQEVDFAAAVISMRHEEQSDVTTV